MDFLATLLWGSVSSFPCGQIIHAHSHESFFHLFYSINGNMTVRVDSQFFPFYPNNILLAGMGRQHELQVDGDASITGELKFTVPVGEMRDKLNAMTGVFTASERAGKWLKDLFEEIEKGIRSNSAIEQALLNTILLQILTDQTQRDTLPQIGTVRPCIAAAIRYIQQNYCRNIRLLDIATDSGFNSNYLCTAFKRDTGLSINEYINMLRIQKAADMILYGDMDISHIASTCGFQGASHFSNTFRRYAGLLPTECRQLFYRSIARLQVFPTHPHHEKAIQTPEYIRICEEIARIDRLVES